MLAYIVVLDMDEGVARVLPFDTVEDAEAALQEAGFTLSSCEWMVTDTIKIGWPS